MAHWLRSQAQSEHVQIIHNHSLWMMPNVYPGQIAKRHNVPFIVSPHGTLSAWAMASGSKVKRVFWPFVQQPALQAVTCWHATAESEYEDIRRLGFKQPVAIVPFGIDVPELPPKRQSQSHTLLFLGRIHQKKGLELLLPAWRAVQGQFPDWRLVIIGPDSGGYRAQMEVLATRLQVERVEFAGPLYGREKWLAYRNAELFVLPTYSENLGMAVAEALAAGTPAIVSKGAPWEGLLKHKAGWWIDIGVDSLVAVLEDALATPIDDLRSMGQKGRSWMQSEFEWNAIAQQIAQCYAWMLGTRARPSCIRNI